jgi:hypothetical protein
MTPLGVLVQLQAQVTVVEQKVDQVKHDQLVTQVCIYLSIPVETGLTAEIVCVHCVMMPISTIEQGGCDKQ